jgi:hypothetical protein
VMHRVVNQVAEERLDGELRAVASLPAATSLALSIDEVGESQWHRGGQRSDGSQFTVESFLRYLIHDPVHHLWDVSGSDPAR